MPYEVARIASMSRLSAVVLLSLCSGFIIAVGSHATWQAPVESGQVLAGLVAYPPDNPYYVYQVKLWSLLNQISAVLLRSGLSEIGASILIAGLLGAVSFLALALTTHAVCGNVVVALLTPLLLQYSGLVGDGVAYPIMLMGTTHSYGIFGLSWLLLIVGLYGNGCVRSGSFCLGLAPAVHPALGAFGLLVAGIALLLNRRLVRPCLSDMGRFFLLGGLITGGSLGWQRYAAAGLGQLDPASRQAYRDAFIANFDLHRNLGTFWSPGGLIAGMTLGFCLYLICRTATPLGQRLAAGMLAASVVCTAMLVVLAQAPPPADFIRMLMPWRFLNLANLAFMPLVIGLLAAPIIGNDGFRRLVLLLLVGVVLIATRFPIMSPLTFYAGSGLALLAGLVLPLPNPSARWRRVSMLATGNALVGALTLVLALLVLIPALASIGRGEYRAVDRFADRSTSDFYRVVAGRPGMLLLAADLHLLQLYTRRPVLVDGGALDFFSYVPETGPQLNRILKRVYGLDIFVPPPPVQKNAGVITALHRFRWQRQTGAEWGTLAREFGVTDVITPDDWVLDLPLVAQGEGLNLYALPVPR